MTEGIATFLKRRSVTLPILPIIYLFMHKLLKKNDRTDLTEEFLRNARVPILVTFIVFPLYF